MSSVQRNEMDESYEVELTGARRRSPTPRDQTRQQVARTRSYSRGRLTQAKRNGQHLTLDDNTHSRQRADSVGFVDTPIGQGPATALHSPRQISALGAVGGLLPLPPPESDLEDRLPHQESMDLQHLINFDEPNGTD